MKRLSMAQVLTLHEQIAAQSGGGSGVRETALLEAALEAPFQTFGGDPLFSTLPAKAARLGYGLICNHPMLDGNKRLGAHVMLVFLALNGVHLHYTQQELTQIILATASGKVRQEQLQAVQIQMQARQAAAQQAAELAGQVEAAALGNAQTGGGAM